MPRPHPRFLLYCHNVLGLGHVTRTLRIAKALIREGECRVRLITGCRVVHRLEVPDEVEIVRLPALRVENGRLVAVDGGSAGKTLHERTRKIAKQVAEFEPRVLLADYNPLGLMGELTRTIDSDTETRLVWGVRDILEAPGRRTRSFLGPAAAASRMSRFHTAIAFTDASWLDTFSQYRGLALPKRLISVGFITGDAEDLDRKPAVPQQVGQPPEVRRQLPLVVALFGGGAHALPLAEVLLRALADRLQRNELRLRLVIGLLSPGARAIHELTDTLPGVDVWSEGSAESSIADADLVVSRAGYNTAYSIVRTAKPVIFVPIVCEDGEQAYRAERLSELEGVETIHEDSANVVELLEQAVTRGLERGPLERSLPFATNGAERAAQALFDIAADSNG